MEAAPLAVLGPAANAVQARLLGCWLCGGGSGPLRGGGRRVWRPGNSTSGARRGWSGTRHTRPSLRSLGLLQPLDRPQQHIGSENLTHTRAKFTQVDCPSPQLFEEAAKKRTVRVPMDLCRQVLDGDSGPNITPHCETLRPHSVREALQSPSKRLKSGGPLSLSQY